MKKDENQRNGHDTAQAFQKILLRFIGKIQNRCFAVSNDLLAYPYVEYYKSLCEKQFPCVKYACFY